MYVLAKIKFFKKCQENEENTYPKGFVKCCSILKLTVSKKLKITVSVEFLYAI